MLEPDDYDLSMRVSRKNSDGADNGLRSLLIHRLTITMKAIGRRPTKAPRRPRMYCEACQRWYALDGFPEVTQCEGCQAYYRAELVVYEQIDANNLRDLH